MMFTAANPAVFSRHFNGSFVPIGLRMVSRAHPTSPGTLL